jgi:Tol biopolymer transport system component
MKHSFLAVVAIALALSGAHADAQSGYDLFQKALAAERADGNLRDAIQLYERVVTQFPKDRPLVARALIRIADCHEKLGQREAGKVYERIIREFADQAESVTVARARLVALQSPAPAAVQAVRKIWSGNDVDAMGSPSADGRLLSYTNWVTGDLGLRDVAAGTSRMLTNTGGWEASGDYAEGSVVSPDGRQVAYAWFIDKGTDPKAKCTCLYELRVMSVSGPDAGKPRILLGVDSEKPWIQPAAWTPDGKGLIVVRSGARDTFDVGVLTFADNAVRVLKTVGLRAPRRVSVSPDGRFIALDIEQAAGTGARDIVMLAVADMRETVAVQHPAHDYSPAFTSDGSQLLFLSDRTGTASLWRQPLSSGRPGGAPVLVAPAATNSAILGTTSNGAAYYWTGGPNSNVYMADLDEQLVARTPPRRAIERFINANGTPAFSPDGRFLAYQSRRDAAQADASGGTIMIHSLATGEDRAVPLRLAWAEGVSWFPDGRSVLVAIRAQRENRVQYYRVDAATGEHQLLMSTRDVGIQQRRPRMSPDGRTLYFIDRVAAEGPRQWILARYDIASAQTTELRAPQDGNPITSFQVSPDGSEVAYLFTDTVARRSILEVMPSTGGTAREIFRDRTLGQARFSGLAWSPDKRYIFVVRDNDLAAPGGLPGASVWKVPTAGGPPETTGIDMPGMIRSLTFDAGGRRLAFAAAGGADPAIWTVENFVPRK